MPERLTLETLRYIQRMLASARIDGADAQLHVRSQQLVDSLVAQIPSNVVEAEGNR